MLKENGAFNKIKKFKSIRKKLLQAQSKNKDITNDVIEIENSVVGKMITINKRLRGRIIDVQLLEGFFVLFETNVGNEKNHQIYFDDL